MKVFISYAHADAPYFEVFHQTLKTQLKSNSRLNFSLWEDGQIPLGSSWDGEIQSKLAACDLAILCVSDNFLGSDYIKAKEFGKLKSQFPETILAPMLLAPCNFGNWDDLAALQLFMPKGNKYDEGTNDDFTFADLVRFNKKDGDLIPNPNIGRYVKDFIAAIEIAVANASQKSRSVQEATSSSKPAYLNPTVYPYFEKDNFFGREELLKEIDDRIKKLDVPLLLSGIGGMGKTAVAVAYGKSPVCSKEYDHIAWIDITENIFSNLFSTFQANSLIPFEYSPDGDPEKDIATLMLALKQLQGNNLLIIDNANDENDLQQFITAWKRYQAGWKCLITTRCYNNAYKRHAVELQVISPQAGEELFKRHNDKRFDKASFQGIYEFIGGHTFLIELLAKFGQESSTINDTAELLAYLKEKGTKALKRNVIAKRGQQQETDKLVSEFVLELYDPLVLDEKDQEYMRYFAVLPATETEFSILNYLFGIEETEKENFDAQLSSLSKQGWLIRKESSFRCHQIIQEICKEKLKPDGKNCAPLIDMLKHLFGYFDTTETVPFFEIGLSFVHNFHEKSWGFGLMMMDLADRITETGNSNEGVRLFQKANELFTELNEQNNAAICLERLGDIYMATGRKEDALTCFKEYNRIEKSLSDNDPDNVEYKNNLAISFSKLGDIYKQQGDVHEALKCYKDYNSIEQTLFDQDPDNLAYKNSLAISYSRLGDLYKQQGNSDEALKCYIQYNALEQELAENNEDTVRYKSNLGVSLSRLGDLYADQGNVNEALKYYKQYHSIENELSEKHPNVVEYKNGLAISFSRLGDLYTQQGNMDEALRCYKEYNRIEQALSDKTPDIIAYKNNLGISFSKMGDVYSDQGNMDDALRCYKEYNRIEQALSDKNPHVLDYKNSLGVSYCRLGDIYKDQRNIDEALKCYIQYNDIAKSLADTNADIVLYQNNLAISFSRLGDIHKQEENVEEALRCYKEYNRIEQSLSDKNPQTIEYKNNFAISYSRLGDLYRLQGNTEEALTCYKEYNRLEKELSDKNPHMVEYKNGLAISFSRLGDLYCDQENMDEALTCYKEYNNIEKVLVDKNPDIVEYKNGLAISYAKLGNISAPEEKRKYCMDARKIWEELVEKVPMHAEFRNNLQWINEILDGLDK